MNENLTLKTIDRLIISCETCQKITVFDEVKSIAPINLELFEFSQSLNPENTISYYSSNSYRYFFELIENRFPPDKLIDLTEKIKIIVSNEILNPVSVCDDIILINPDFPVPVILGKFEQTFITLFNRHSINGFKQAIKIESTLFGRGNQLGKQKVIIFSGNKLKKSFLSGQTLLDTEQLDIDQSILFFDRDSGFFQEMSETGNEMVFIETCSFCNSNHTQKIKVTKFSGKKTAADKIILFIPGDLKLPFFFRAKPDQIQLIQFLFSEDNSGETTHFNNFIKRFSAENQNIEWFTVNSDLLSEKPDPTLFINDHDSFCKILMEVLRGTVMWKKDKFLDFHSVSKLSGNKIKIHDPIHILGEVVYRNKILDWIGDLEEKIPENFGFGMKTIFR